jgi:hypothetical protein
MIFVGCMPDAGRIEGDHNLNLFITPLVVIDSE